MTGPCLKLGGFTVKLRGRLMLRSRLMHAFCKPPAHAGIDRQLLLVAKGADLKPGAKLFKAFR